MTFIFILDERRNGVFFLFQELQHRLDRRGYLSQAGIVLAGIIFIALGAPPRRGIAAVALFDCGVILVAVFLFCPEIIYHVLRLYGRKGSVFKVTGPK